jgi:preprotein translocase subunit SecG
VTIFLYVIYTIVCVLLIIAILMQAGRGGGLAEAFSSAESLLGGAQTNKFMVKVTAVMVALFIGLCLFFARIHAQRQHSLIEDLPDRPRSTVVNVEKLFDQEPSQTIEINAAAPADTLPNSEMPD